ncbi:MAG: ABC-F family ATP-binding cassette domain-containing protein [Bacteroidetes bacterium]|nr:ABC-F family ATP-binding cassette domain-containing protein [Bacteroidota bacterium]MBK9542709.1 ABC-F family ATP-binding cassette domain-containing protein [Bacteroidota bacterium]MBL0257048.1 ABC-F family ATP-binding cassette domain-containing protein [Bacteroidota bacterium]MBP6401833.1 ABC-F family ATP-binding cassette domain-containing protein [Bacteroidia bacterium]MBP6648208.1 ABC-F family ATP-binding cassette domain-containing protein [Bacteroidia bacterium]
MNLLSVENLSKSYGEKILFDGISFGIAKGEKVALIARNGTGKTTLMRILAGQDNADSGDVTMRKDIRVAYLDQDPFLDTQKTVLEVIFSMDNPIIRLLKEYEACLEADAEAHSPITQKALEEAASKMDDAHAWDYEVRVRQVLSRLNIHHLDQKVRQLSGGQRKRIALAKTLIEPAELLIMDEPTNHLDVEMVEWLEEFLTRSQLSLLLVTHDRYFLDNICDKIIELENNRLFTYEGNYSYFLEKKAEREWNESQETDKARNLMRTELEWMRRMPKARGTKSKARIDSFYELKDKAAGKKTQGTIELDVKMNRIGGKVIELKKVNKRFDELTILNGFDYTFRTGERIGIVGKNGAGKSTFLNLLTGKELPDSGKINVGDTIIFGYYSQQGLELKDDKRVIEVVKDYAEVIQLSDGSKVSASQFLNLFQFPPEQQFTYVSKLSGGERRRLHLLTVLIRNPNFLILDEPTNDLDLLTLGILEEFLLNYKGCLIIVSHDRYFMDKLVDHLFIFEGNGVIKDYNGTYTEWRMVEEEKEKEAARAKNKEVEEQKKRDNTNKGDKKKLSYKERLEYENLGKAIELLEKEKLGLEDQMGGTEATHIQLQEWALRMEQVIQEIDEKSMRWLELSELA